MTEPRAAASGVVPSTAYRTGTEGPGAQAHPATLHAVPANPAYEPPARLVRAVCGRFVRPSPDSWPPSASRPDVSACADCVARLLDPGPPSTR
jgi:hypothetical protein